jgi:hypothetical protein
MTERGKKTDFRVEEPECYRLEWRPGRYCFYRPEDYTKEGDRVDSARVWGLYRQPQAGCPTEPAVYRGRHFVQPEYTSAGRCPDGFVPLFLGPVLNEPVLDAEVALLFPSILEARLEQEQPHLFPHAPGRLS